LPPRFSAYNEGVSPEIRWSGAPSTTKSLVLLMEDPDAKRLKPVIHWVAYDIPADASGLPMGLPTDPELDAPVKGMLQGKNSHDATGYFGPRPPDGDPPHHYHFQVFALDAKLGLEPGADREQVLKAMKGHVVARGEVVATFSKPK
jgi:Raf kinase inhibitor-like YbhB/YbcL family protein